MDVLISNGKCSYPVTSSPSATISTLSMNDQPFGAKVNTFNSKIDLQKLYFVNIDFGFRESGWIDPSSAEGLPSISIPFLVTRELLTLFIRE